MRNIKKTPGVLFGYCNINWDKHICYVRWFQYSAIKLVFRYTPIVYVLAAKMDRMWTSNEKARTT